eukprot:8433335-Pyramimonas_sp.AAC.1
MSDANDNPVPQECLSSENLLDENIGSFNPALEVLAATADVVQVTAGSKKQKSVGDASNNI